MKIFDYGEIVIMDAMGYDEDIAAAARVSYHPASTKQKGSMRDLIRYLMRHKHTSPFEMVEFKFYLKIPIFVARQWIRHRTANVNEMSGRYSVMPTEFFVYDEYNKQSVNNKQGSSDETATGHDFEREVEKLSNKAFNLYTKMVSDEFDISREQARIHLPLSTYTEMVWKIDLHNLFHFLKLRTDPHAQREIRECANAIASMVQLRVPVAYEAWLDYSKNAYTLSAMEVEVIQQLLRGETDVKDLEPAKRMSKREMDEFATKFIGK